MKNQNKWFLYLDDRMFWFCLPKDDCEFVTVPIRVGDRYMMLMYQPDGNYTLSSPLESPGHGTLVLPVPALDFNFLGRFLPQLDQKPTRFWPWKQPGEGFKLTIKNGKGDVLHVFPTCFVDPADWPKEEQEIVRVKIDFIGYEGLLTQLSPEDNHGEKTTKKKAGRSVRRYRRGF